VAFAGICKAQYNQRPTKSRFFNSKHSTFQIKPGDILVYSAGNGGDTYDVVLTVKKYGDVITLNYSIPQKTQSGTVNIQNNLANSASTYDYYFVSNNNNPTDKSSIWLSKQNWRDLASTDKKTNMDFGGGAESFIRAGASTQKIKYKGRDKIITVYNIANKNTEDKKTFTVLTDEKNPLIVSMNYGGTLTLKEVR
jgi:hypothetical protein